MRAFLLLVSILFASLVSGQAVRDGRFINKRWLINSSASLLQYQGVDGPILYEAEPIGTYALDEPYYWTKRVHFRLDPTENSALLARSDTDSILPLFDIINLALASGSAMAFHDVDFRVPMSNEDHRTIVAGAIFLKVDFSYDTLTHTASPLLMGLSVQQPDGKFVHFYYPELRYVLEKYHVRSAKDLVRTDEYFRRFLFKGHWAERKDIQPAPVERLNYGTSLEQQAELDALTELFLVEQELERGKTLRSGMRKFEFTHHPFGPVRVQAEYGADGKLAHVRIKKGKRFITSASYKAGKLNGPYRAFYRDGSLREEGSFKNGLRDDDWTSWHPNGNIRSRRIYEAGSLHGRQRVYYDNGKQWLEYDMKHGEYEGTHKTWYDDGSMKASGQMSDGFVSGEWDYSIRMTDKLVDHLTEQAALYKLPPGSWQDGVLSYHVTYFNADPASRTGMCIFDRCIKWEYSDVR